MFHAVDPDLKTVVNARVSGRQRRGRVSNAVFKVNVLLLTILQTIVGALQTPAPRAAGGVVHLIIAVHQAVHVVRVTVVHAGATVDLGDAADRPRGRRWGMLSRGGLVSGHSAVNPVHAELVAILVQWRAVGTHVVQMDQVERFEGGVAFRQRGFDRLESIGFSQLGGGGLGVSALCTNIGVQALVEVVGTVHTAASRLAVTAVVGVLEVAIRLAVLQGCGATDVACLDVEPDVTLMDGDCVSELGGDGRGGTGGRGVPECLVDAVVDASEEGAAHGVAQVDARHVVVVHAPQITRAVEDVALAGTLVSRGQGQRRGRDVSHGGQGQVG